MKQEKQVSSLELSIKLEKLGVKQDSISMWVKFQLWKEARVYPSDLAMDMEMLCLSGKREYAYSAFTVAELGEILKEHELETIWEGKKWQAFQTCKSEMFTAKTEADARAKLLIHLLENKLIKLC